MSVEKCTYDTCADVLTSGDALGQRVFKTEPPYTPSLGTYKASSSCEFLVFYEQLNDLSLGLVALAERHSNEYSLHL